MHQKSANFFAGVIGHTSDTQGSTSTAYHYPAGVPFGFALYSNTVVASGNQAEIVKGPVYVNRYIQPQSGGQSAFCANPSKTTAADGYILFGTPQKGDSGYDAKNNPGQADTPQDSNKDNPVQWFPLCDTTNTSGGVVNQTGPLVDPSAPPESCPTISGTNTTLTYNLNIAACVANPVIQPPSMDPPPTPWNVVGSLGGNKGNVWSTLPSTPGVYEVQHNANCLQKSGCYDLAITPSDKTGGFDLNGYTFVLDKDATIQFNGGLKTGPATTLTPYNGGTGKPTDGKYAIYAPSGSAFVNIDNQDGDGTPTLVITSGTIYIPTGTVQEINNGSLQIQAGQAVAANWDVTSGNHPNPEITYDSGSVAPEHEFLGLVQ
jgi:hypothetical protein